MATDHDLPYSCNQCDRAFGSTHGLNVHKYRVHTGKNWNSVQKGSTRIGKRFQPPTSQISQTVCPICAKEFRKRPNVAHHIRVVHGKSIMDFPHLMVGYKRRARTVKRRKSEFQKEKDKADQFWRNKDKMQPKPAPMRGHVDYCPRCGQNIKAFELAAGFLT